MDSLLAFISIIFGKKLQRLKISFANDGVDENMLSAML